MSFAEAIAADRAGDLKLASAEYERVLASGDRSLEVLVRLALLYWQATDPGTAAAKKLDRGFFAFAARRHPELLDEAIRRFPTSTVPRFWRRYIEWADLGLELGEDDCMALLREDPSELLPAMHVFAITSGRRAEAEARKLLLQYREDGTTGSRYIVSVIRGVLGSARRSDEET